MDTQALKSDLNSKNKNAKCLLPVTYQYRISKSKQEKHQWQRARGGSGESG